MTDRRRALALLLRLPFRDEPWRPVVGVGLQLVSQAAFVAVAWSLKLVVDGMARGDDSAAPTAAVLLGVGTLLTIAAGFASYVVRMGMVERTTLIADAELATLTSSIPGIDHHERPDHLDRLELLRNDHRSLASLPDLVALSSTTFIRLFATIVVLVRVDTALLMLLPCAIPSALASWRAQRRSNDAQESIAPAWRRQAMLFRLVGQEPSAREVRVFGGQAGLVRRYDESIDEGNAALFRAAGRNAVEQTIGWGIFGTAFAVALVVVARRAIAGDATAGDLVLAITLGSQLTGQLAGFATMISAFAAAMQTAERYGWLVDRARTELAAPPGGPATVPNRLAEGIRFDNVSFEYPGTDRPVLRNVDLLLPAGATVAIVGDNGAGKTTIVKLLTRMYEPTSGQILIDGIPLAGLDPAEWRARTSAAFQDHARLELMAQHVVGVGSLPSVDDEPTVLHALSAAHATDVVAALPTGLATQLGRQFDDGAELSGGQWQKLAVARAMMRDDPLLLVLDEPTAALDAPTEAALFERYADAAQRARSETGGITIIVSHRFSTVRMADLILVVDESTITEAGTHAELIGRRGLYAELYELQSRSYR